MIILTVSIVLLLVLISAVYLHQRGSAKQRGGSSADIGTAYSRPQPGEVPPEGTPGHPALVGTDSDIRQGTRRSGRALQRVFARLRRSAGSTIELWDELEETLLLSDLGLALTEKVIEASRKIIDQEGLVDGEAAAGIVRSQLRSLFIDAERDLKFSTEKPTVWLVVGVNGVGKTTSIGKLSSLASANGRRVVLAAADTFRAAAADQLQTWAERTGADMVRSVPGADPSSVVFDAIQKAAARGFDLVIADTAGRLHTKSNLMDELRKLRRTAGREPGNLTEVLLVLDATTGQNGLIQAKEFAQAAGITGVVLTKLDGSAKGGVALAVENELGVPIKLVGVGEHAKDLIPFVPDDFLSALIESDDSGTDQDEVEAS